MYFDRFYNRAVLKETGRGLSLDISARPGPALLILSQAPVFGAKFVLKIQGDIFRAFPVYFEKAITLP